jgi:hypothetical protein
MKTIEKRFIATELVTYSRSNATKCVSFETLEEAAAFQLDQKKKHPRSKKITPTVWDSVDKKTIWI